MESIEVIVWLLAVAGAVAANLYKQWRRRTAAPPPQPRPAVAVPTPVVLEPPPKQQQQQQHSRFDETAWGHAPQHEEAALLEAVSLEALPTPAHSAPQALAAQPAPSAPHPAPPGLRRRGALFNPRADLRSAVIGMAVLGPCRAQAPYEPPP